MIRRLLLAFAVSLALVPDVVAHDTRPAALSLVEEQAGWFSAHLRQPATLFDTGQGIRPVFPGNCPVRLQSRDTLDGWRVEHLRIDCPLDEGEIRFDGLARTITDIYVQIDYQHRADISALINRNEPALNLALTEQHTVAVTAYLRLGLDHIVTGYDHILFTIGLFLLVGRARIIPVLLAFTVAHGVTLLLTMLGWVALPGPLIETLIALSLVLLAKEVANQERGLSGLTTRWPMIIVFGFGLVHGAGFAGALSEIGLPEEQTLTALALFNIGVELGQIAILLLYALVLTGLAHMKRRLGDYMRTASIYSIGGIGAYWALERGFALFA